MLKFAHRLRTNSNKRKPILGYSKLQLVQIQCTSFLISFSIQNIEIGQPKATTSYMKYKRISKACSISIYAVTSFVFSHIKSWSYKHSIMKCLLTYSCNILGSFLLNQNYIYMTGLCMGGMRLLYTASHKAISIQNIFTSNII